MHRATCYTVVMDTNSKAHSVRVGFDDGGNPMWTGECVCGEKLQTDYELTGANYAAGPGGRMGDDFMLVFRCPKVRRVLAKQF